jgi:Zn finger protein HypA/HybF involved in hydrogenase expression
MRKSQKKPSGSASAEKETEFYLSVSNRVWCQACRGPEFAPEEVQVECPHCETALRVSGPFVVANKVEVDEMLVVHGGRSSTGKSRP